MGLNDRRYDFVQLLSAVRHTKVLQVLFPQRNVLFELSRSPVIQMNDTPFNGLVLKIKLFLLPFELLLSDSLGLLQLLFVMDSVDEKWYFSVFPMHLILMRPPVLDNVFNFAFGEEFFDLVKVELLEHVLHDVVYSVSHYDN
jgi:hypothetical protein